VRHKLAAPVALAAAVAVFFGVFLATESLLWSPLLATVAAIGVYLMVDDRSSTKVDSDNYADEAERKVDEALRTVREVRRLARDVPAPAARAALESACQYVPELFERVKARSPNSLYSTASQIGGHLTSLEGAVKQYLDIQRNPVLYTNPQIARTIQTPTIRPETIMEVADSIDAQARGLEEAVRYGQQKRAEVVTAIVTANESMSASAQHLSRTVVELVAKAKEPPLALPAGPQLPASVIENAPAVLRDQA
jgi:hypothetical protein